MTDYSDLLHVPTREERLAMFRKPAKKWTMYPASSKEIKAKLRAYGFSTSDFIRVGGNVVVADNAIIVIIKREPGLQPQSISIWDFPLDEYWQDDLTAKNWASEDVKKDFMRAITILQKKNEISKIQC